jgi:hypothetical protein
MRSQGVYPTPEPHRSPVPRGFLPLLAILALIAAVTGLAVMVVRRGPAVPPQVQTPSVVPALVSRPIAYPALPDTKALCARNRIFADEVLGAQQASLADWGVLSVVVPPGPVVYNLPKPMPSLWLTCRRCADEALGELRMPAPQAQTSSVVPALVSRPIAYSALPDTKALVARNRIFADEVLASASYDFGASTAAFEWSNEVTPQTGPR